ncbi:MAG TPA: hypothetical protein VNO54_24720 [Streptosporangiaceae bacterium]|nr:hypothetical protein [Streptosporangiaceae bacterium]
MMFNPWGNPPQRTRIPGGNPPMRPDQLAAAQTRSRAGTGPAPSQDIVVARRVIVTGPDDGVFVYIGTPGPGTLIESVAANPGTDPYGNAYLAGFASYPVGIGPVIAAELTAGALQFLMAATPAGPYTLEAQISPSLNGLQYLFPHSAGLAVIAPSGDATGVTDASNISTAVANGISVLLTPGAFYVAANSVVLDTGQYLAGSGYHSTFVNGVGTGVVFQQTHTGAYNATVAGGSIGGPSGLTVDVSAMGAGSVGVQVGNIFGLHVNVEVNDTSGRSPALAGIYCLNDVHWTESLYLEHAYVNGCTITFDVAGALTSTNSFKGVHGDLYVNQRGITANDGLQLLNGALLYDTGLIKYTGNFAGGASAVTSCTVRISGTVPAGHPNAGSASAFRAAQLAFGPECAAGAFTPQTIIFGSSANVIADCGGVMDFSADGGLNTFTASNWPGSGSFWGPIVGDSSLDGLSRLAAGPLTLDKGVNIGHGNAAQALMNNSTITTAGLTYAPCSLTAAVTGIVMAAGTFSGQTCVVANEATLASGFTITFAAAGSNVGTPGVVVGPKTGALFVWNEHVAQWLRVQAP